MSRSIDDSVFVVYEANEHCIEQDPNNRSMHGYDVVGFVKTQLKAKKLLATHGNYGSSDMPLYLVQQVFKIV